MGLTNIEIVHGYGIRVLPAVVYDSIEEKFYMIIVYADKNLNENLLSKSFPALMGFTG